MARQATLDHGRVLPGEDEDTGADPQQPISLRAISEDGCMDEPRTDFFFGAMSPYSWLAAERIAGLLPQARWRAVFLGGLFHGAGRESWGFSDRREQEMAECERRAAEYGLGPMQWPERWPTSDLAVARAMTFAEREGTLERFALAAMRLAFLEGRDLEQRETVLEAGARSALDSTLLERALADETIKLALREETERALARGVVGVPTLAVGEQLFWGDDRLEEAAAAARAGAARAE